jgi:hypothetical protein
MRDWLLGVASDLWQWLNSLSQWMLGVASNLWQWLLGHALNFWQWLGGASEGQATFLGTLIGSSFGLLAILAGALFNAHLNRRRDNRLRREDRKALIAALLAELGDFRDHLQQNVDDMKEFAAVAGEEGKQFYIRMMPRVRLLPDVIPKLGLLDAATVRKVIAAYNVAEGYDQVLRSNRQESEPRMLDPSSVDAVIELTEFAMDVQDRAILALGGRPRDHEWRSPPQNWLRSTG